MVVTGQVLFPGEYTLLSKTEKLSDVVTRAGGGSPPMQRLSARGLGWIYSGLCVSGRQLKILCWLIGIRCTCRFGDRWWRFVVP